MSNDNDKDQEYQSGSSIMRLLQNMRKQRIRATKKQGRMPNRTTEIPTGIKRIHPFDN